MLERNLVEKRLSTRGWVCVADDFFCKAVLPAYYQNRRIGITLTEVIIRFVSFEIIKQLYKTIFHNHIMLEIGYKDIKNL